MADAQFKAARERAAALRKNAERRERLRRRLAVGAFVLAVVGLIALATVAIYRSGQETEPRANVDLAAASGRGTKADPPWALPADVPARVKAAGLNLGPMGTAEHYHAHLDILVDGQPVPVPTDIGIDPSSGAMSAVHTHTSDGIIHVEAASKGQPFTLGQLFTQWDVSLSGNHIGSLTGGNGKSLTAYVDGKKATGNPAMIRLAERQQIALVFRPTDAQLKVPDSFNFGKDL